MSQKERKNAYLSVYGLCKYNWLSIYNLCMECGAATWSLRILNDVGCTSTVRNGSKFN